MEDRFKFRIWDDWLEMFLPESDYFLKPNGLFAFYEGRHRGEHMEGRYIKLHCTGAKDKNDKLIYEKDICFVSRPNTFFNKGENFLVEYNQNTCAFMYKYNRGDWNWAFGNDGHYLIGKNRGKSTVCEIVGNIFKNKELLEKNE